MKNETIATIAGLLLIIVLGLQAYATFRINDRLDQLLAPETHISVPPAELANPVNPAVKNPLPEDDFFKDKTWNPYAEMQHMQDKMQQLFGESMSRFHMNTPIDTLTKIPEVDLRDDPDNYVVTVNAPGAEESSINVKLEDQLLHITIKTEQSKAENPEADGKYQYRERFAGEFQRLLTLPGPADASKMKTEYRNGVLTITIPKKA